MKIRFETEISAGKKDCVKTNRNLNRENEVGWGVESPVENQSGGISENVAISPKNCNKEIFFTVDCGFNLMRLTLGVEATAYYSNSTKPLLLLSRHCISKCR